MNLLSQASCINIPVYMYIHHIHMYMHIYIYVHMEAADWLDKDMGALHARESHRPVLLHSRLHNLHVVKEAFVSIS